MQFVRLFERFLNISGWGVVSETPLSPIDPPLWFIDPGYLWAPWIKASSGHPSSLAKVPIRFSPPTGEGGGGVTCHDFDSGRAESPAPHPIHILGEVKKKYPFIFYTSHSEHCTYSYTSTIFQILPIHILFGWKRYPIDILLKFFIFI